MDLILQNSFTESLDIEDTVNSNSPERLESQTPTKSLPKNSGRKYFYVSIFQSLVITQLHASSKKILSGSLM